MPRKKVVRKKAAKIQKKARAAKRGGAKGRRPKARRIPIASVRTVRGVLERQAKARPDQVFLFFKDEEVRYRTLDETANRVANGLMNLGVKQGDKVALLLPNRPEFILAWLGCLKAGMVAVPINTLLKGEEIQFILQNSEASALVTVFPFLDLVGKIAGGCPKLAHVVSVGEGTAATRLPGGVTLGNWANLILAPATPPDVRVRPEDLAAIIYTSGTTGHPKGVMLSQYNYVVNAKMIAGSNTMSPADRFVCFLPLFHVNAQVVTTLAPLSAGGSMVLLEKFSPNEFLPALARYKATAFSGVPTVYAILNSLPDAESYDLSHLRFCICGAAPMPVEVFETFERKYKARIVEGYGLSEGTCGSTLNPIDGTRKVGSIGIPLPGQTMRIVDDRGRKLPAGETGEIAVKGKNVMQGYYRNPDATAATLRSGWLHTGDLGFQDKDGYFFIVGRKKEMIIRGGENIYPKEVEEVLYRHAAVAEAAVCGVPDKIWGEEVVAFLVLKPGASVTEEEIIAYTKSHVADFKCPRKVVVRAAFPKTATGKIQKGKIVEAYCAEMGIDAKARFAAAAPPAARPAR